MIYNPGLHILSEVKTKEKILLEQEAEVKAFFNKKIHEYKLNKLGEVYHKFPEGGFTGVICLTESHIAIHTWPEYGLFTFDIYLSNFNKDNDDVTRNFFMDTISFFKSDDYTRNEVKR
jgi:S-adenosylmethionine decarboxylase